MGSVNPDNQTAMAANRASTVPVASPARPVSSLYGGPQQMQPVPRANPVMPVQPINNAPVMGGVPRANPVGPTQPINGGGLPKLPRATPAMPTGGRF